LRVAELVALTNISGLRTAASTSFPAVNASASPGARGRDPAGHPAARRAAYRA
jgi:hypothetical protein